MSQKPLPPRPMVTYQSTPDVAVANTIGKMSEHGHEDGKVLEMLSTISLEDVSRLSLFLTMGQDRDIGAAWLARFAYTELALSNSVPAKLGGIRSEQFVQITKSPDMMMQNDGFFGKIRNRLGGGGNR